MHLLAANPTPPQFSREVYREVYEVTISRDAPVGGDIEDCLIFEFDAGGVGRSATALGTLDLSSVCQGAR